MLKKSCTDPLGNIGICMFKWDCISQRGITLSTCVNGFLFGACCSFKEVSQEAWTTDSFSKSTYANNNAQNVSASLREYITQSYTQKNTDPSDSEEEILNYNSFLTRSKEVSKFYQFSVTTDSTDTLTSDTITNNINGINGMATIRNTPYDPNINISGYSNLVNKIIYSAIINPGEEIFQKPTNDSKSTNLELQLDTNNSKISHVNKITNSTEMSLATETLYKADSLKEKNFTAVPAVYEVITKNNNSEILLLNQDLQKVANIGSSKTKNETLGLETELKQKISINGEQNITSEQNYLKTNSFSIITSKDFENSTYNQTLPPSADNNAHVFPSSLQAVISQLTSREATFVRPEVDPTAQTNLSSLISSTGKIKTFDSFLHNNQNNTLKLTLNNIYPDVKTYSMQNMSALKESHGIPGIPESFSQTSVNIPNSSISNIPEIIKTTVILKAHTEMPETDNESTSESSSTGTTERHQVVSSGYFFESGVLRTTNAFNNAVIHNVQEDSRLDCNSKYNVNENCTKRHTSFEKSSLRNPYTASHSDMPSDTNIAYGDSNFVTHSFESNATVDESYKNKINEILTTLSDTSNAGYVYDQETPTTVYSFPTSSDMKVSESKDKLKDVEQTDNVPESYIVLDSAVSIPNSVNDDEFLFDISTDILTYFAKPEVTNSNSPVVNGSNFLFTTNGLEEKLSLDYTMKKLFTPSQPHTQQIYDDPFENTINEILDDSTSKYSTSTSNMGDNFFNITVVQHSSVIADITIPNIRNENTIDDDAMTTEILTNKNFTIHDTFQVQEYHENSEFHELNVNANVYSINASNSLDPVYFENTVTHFASDTDSEFIFSTVSEQNSAKTNDMPNATENLFQNVTGIFSETSSLTPFVNISITAASENSSSTDMTHNNSNQEMDQTVDNFNFSITEIISTMYINMTTLGNQTSTLTSNSSVSQMTSQSFSTTSTISPQVSGEPVRNKVVWNYKKGKYK